jgi:hypothetical protein
VSLNRSTVELPSAAKRSLLTWNLNRPQRVLLSLVRTVQNLCDEADVQCVMFLASELGMIRPAPFYFSRSGVHGAPAPVSLVLRDTLQKLLDGAILAWENGALRCSVDLGNTVPDLDFLRTDAASLERLSVQERKALASTALNRHRTGQDQVASRIEGPSKTALAGVWGS